MKKVRGYMVLNLDVRDFRLFEDFVLYLEYLYMQKIKFI